MLPGVQTPQQLMEWGDEGWAQQREGRGPAREEGVRQAAVYRVGSSWLCSWLR